MLSSISPLCQLDRDELRQASRQTWPGKYNAPHAAATGWNRCAVVFCASCCDAHIFTTAGTAASDSCAISADCGLPVSPDTRVFQIAMKQAIYGKLRA